MVINVGASFMPASYYPQLIFQDLFGGGGNWYRPNTFDCAWNRSNTCWDRIVGITQIPRSFRTIFATTGTFSTSLLCLEDLWTSSHRTSTGYELCFLINPDEVKIWIPGPGSSKPHKANSGLVNFFVLISHPVTWVVCSGHMANKQQDCDATRCILLTCMCSSKKNQGRSSGFNFYIMPGLRRLWDIRPVYTCDFWCDFAYKTCPTLPHTGF